MFDTRELGRRPGALKRISRSAAAPKDLGIEVIGVPEGATVELDLRLESVMEGVLVTGTARAPLTGECVRCLEPLERELEADFQEMYSYPDADDRSRDADTGDDAEEEDRLFLEADLFDLEPVLRDAVVLALPLQPVCRVRFDDNAGTELRFVDQRTFGGLSLHDTVPGDLEGLPDAIAHIARDPLDPAFDEAAFHTALRRRRTTIKRALLDQSLISGVGNIYADEALWRARLHYDRPTATLARPRAAELLGHVREVMTAALAVGGTSFDSLYVNVNGESGYFERSLDAYGREDEPCRRCGTAMRRRRRPPPRLLLIRAVRPAAPGRPWPCPAAVAAGAHGGSGPGAVPRSRPSSRCPRCPRSR
ncbi:Formamidopyrimidine-DNA glycosylase [Streptomyces antimycoticus]